MVVNTDGGREEQRKKLTRTLKAYVTGKDKKDKK